MDRSSGSSQMISDARKHRQLRVQQVLSSLYLLSGSPQSDFPHEAQKIFSGAHAMPQEEWTEKLARCFSEDTDLDILKYSIEHLDGDLIPRVPPLSMNNGARVDALSHTTPALHSLDKIFVTLHIHKDSHKTLKVYNDECYKILVDYWPGIVKWMIYLVTYSGQSNSPPELMSVCSHLLHVFSIDMEDNVMQKELICRTHVADLIYLILCQADPRTLRYYSIPLGGLQTGCIILKLVQTCFNLDASRDILVLRFNSVGKRTRGTIIRSLVTRTEEILAAATELHLLGAIADLHAIVHIFMFLAVEVDLHYSPSHHKILETFARALSALSSRGHREVFEVILFWTQVGDCVAMLTRCAAQPCYPSGMSQLVNGGLLGCVAQSSEHVRNPEWDSQIRTLLPYLYPSSVYTVAQKCGAVASWLNPIPSDPDQGVSSIYVDFHALYECLFEAYERRRGRHVSMCSNLYQHSNGLVTTPSDIKTRIGMHSIQRNAISLEAGIGVGPHLPIALYGPKRSLPEQKPAFGWPSFQRRLDAIRILDTIVNVNFESPSEIEKSDLGIPAYSAPNASHLLKCRPTSALELVSFYLTSENEVVVHSRVPLSPHFCSLASWNASVSPWLPRLQALVDQKEGDPDVLLVEGRFRLNHWHALNLVVFATFRYDSSAPAGQKYSVMSSTFRSVKL
ncbi:hypothetical protein NMY22_g7277 [Coprinellus aureogranulatus]|nr:hypothetical protein NMY22_g7277 [Coprinellus aureogranulatus]